MAQENEIKKLKSELRRKDIEISKLKSIASKDELTGVYNRRGFKEEVARVFDNISFAGSNIEARKHFFISKISLLFFDIDNFKKINDTYGHKAGDQVIQYVVNVISQKLRSIDVVGRLGGEEIAVALVGSDEQDAYRKAEEIRKAIKQRVKVSLKQMVPITVSIGVAQMEKDSTLDEFIKSADEAMYKAKQSGKNKTVKSSDFKTA